MMEKYKIDWKQLNQVLNYVRLNRLKRIDLGYRELKIILKILALNIE